MKDIYVFILISMVLFSCSTRSKQSNALSEYNVIWDTQSASSVESMPVGGHSIGCNVWVENGDVMFYAQRSGSFTENNEYHKLGRFRLKLQPNPFKDGTSFRQELKLHEGYVEIKGKKNETEVTVNLWVEALRPVIHLDIESNDKLKAEVIYENWRTETKHLNTEINYGPAFGCFSWMCYPDSIFRYHDVIYPKDNGVLFYHRNRDDKLLIDYAIHQQGLENVRNDIVNTQKGRTFGGFMTGKGFVQKGTTSGRYIESDYNGWVLASKEAGTNHSINIFTHVDQTESMEKWNSDLQMLVNEEVSHAEALRNTREWWTEFWEKSWLKINPGNCAKDSVAWSLARNYQLFRYQLGCNYYGESPTKFNGGNFTVDPNLVFAKGDPKKKPFTPCGTPDWRAWGGGSFTAQNQRLLYWPMLKTGDFEGMKPQFDFYKHALPSAIARVKEYWGHNGCCFTEQMENFGLPIAAGWGWSEPNAKRRKREQGTLHGTMTNAAIKYHYESQLEFSFMILEYHRYTGNDISMYMDFIKQSVIFYDEHYQMRAKELTGKPLDNKGKLVIYPSTACETYKDATNPTDAVSGLRACLNALLELPGSYLSKAEKQNFEAILERVPEFSYEDTEKGRIIKPAHSWSRMGNSECPQFYPLFPFNNFELGKDDKAIEIFRNTWEYGGFAKNNVWSWHQDGIFFARMGLTEKAMHYNTKKMKDSDQRFPTFWGPGHDWVPDHNWGGSGMLGLQEMLMQTVSDKILLFPAWPKEWNVDFKLHAPQNTTVEGKLINGELIDLKVIPKERRKDIVISGL